MIGPMPPLEEVAPGLWRFTVARNGLPPTMTAYALRDGEDTILVDPLVAGETEPLLATYDEIVRGRVCILVTTPFHVRGSELLRWRWRDRHEITIFGHEHGATRLDDRSAFTFLHGETGFPPEPPPAAAPLQVELRLPPGEARLRQLREPIREGRKAEGEGFEPSSDLTARNGFRDRRIRPLCHPSAERCDQTGGYPLVLHAAIRERLAAGAGVCPAGGEE